MKRRCVFLGVCLAAMLWGDPAWAQEAVSEQPYRADIKWGFDIRAGEGRRQTLDTQIGLGFRWQRTATQRALVLTDMQNRQTTNGVEQLNNRMCRDHYEETRNGTTAMVKAQDSPAELQRILRDSFDVPLCTIAVDGSGAEVERHLSSAPGAAPILDQAVIDFVALFPPIAVTKAEYTVRTGVNSGLGIRVEGEVKYTKIPVSEPGKTRWQVSGQLTRDNILLPGVSAPSTVRGTLSGTLDYDDKTHQLLSAECSLDLAYTTIKDGKTIGSAQGTTTIRVRRAAEK